MSKNIKLLCIFSIILLNITVIYIAYKYATNKYYLTIDEHNKIVNDLNIQLETKNNIIKAQLKERDLIKHQLEEALNKKPEKVIKTKYEKITDTLIYNPFKRDSITYNRLLFYIQNRDRFSPKGFNVDK